MIVTEPIPFGLLIFLVLLAFALIAGFWLAQKFIFPLIKIQKTRRSVEMWLFQTQLIAWAFFAIFSLYELLLASPFITLVLLLVGLLLGLPFWKDFIPGIIFRLDNQVTVRDTIRINGQESSVETIGWCNLITSNAAGETIITPYHKLNSAVITRARAAGKLIKHNYTIQVPSKENVDTVNQIKQYLSECPWTTPTHPPTIKKLEEDTFQITAFATDKFVAEKQKAYALWRVEQDG